MAVFETMRSGSTVPMAVGDEIVVRLPETPATGYAWTLSTVDSRLSVIGDSFELAAAAPSDAGHRVFRLRANQPGAAVAELDLRHPADDESLGTFIVRAAVS